MEDRHDRDDRFAHRRGIADRGPQDLLLARCRFIDQHRGRCFQSGCRQTDHVSPAAGANFGFRVSLLKSGVKAEVDRLDSFVASGTN